jgi:predicted nucleotidyltransferase
MTHVDLPPLSDVILRLAGICERTGVPYAVGGAVAASFWGVPRTTQDADLLVSVPALVSQHFADALAEEGFSVVDTSGGGMPTVTGLRRQSDAEGLMRLARRNVPVEMFVPVVPLQHEILRRATDEPFHGRTIKVTSAEDLILLKMAFHRQKDIQDVRGILGVQKGRLDLGHLRSWSARTLDDQTAAELDRLIAAAGMA